MAMDFVCTVFLATLVVGASAHGLVTSPRMRGALDFSRDGVTPKTLTDDATTDFCPHCLNGGGTVKSAGDWTPYEPMVSTRDGFGVCGDAEGVDDHMKTGQFANPPSLPFVANYEPGGVANFEVDITTNHGGYLEFYLCDVGSNPDEDIQFSTFARDCEYLERVPKDSCEAGTDDECGPIDPDFPGRWVLPCRNAAGDQGDQVLGGSNGKIAYRIPNKKIDVGVVHMYWLTTNTCNTPDGFMQNYDYPEAWAGCPGDGGSIGGKPQQEAECGSGGFPEEFWNCADVTVGGGDGSAPESVSVTEPVSVTVDDDVNDRTVAVSVTPDDVADLDVDVVADDEETDTSAGGDCIKDWQSCSSGSSCCSSDYECAQFWGSPEMCVPKSAEKGADAEVTTSGSGDSEDDPVVSTVTGGSTTGTSTRRGRGRRSSY